MIFGTLQCCFILSISVDLKFIEQNGATWRKLITLNLTEVSIRCSANQSEQITNYNQLQQYIERWKDRDCVRSV